MRLRETDRRPDELRYRRAAWRCSGALVGALVGWILGLFNTIEPLTSAMVLAGYGLLSGAIVGAVLGWLGVALQRGQRVLRSDSGRRPPYCDVDVADSGLQLQVSGNRKE